MPTVRGNQSILVGEGELEVRGYLSTALKCLGYSVELAEDGDEVLSCLRDSRSDISAVLLDLMIPSRDGLDTLVEIRRTDPTLPVIIVSSVSSPMDVVTAMKCGATDFLRKPVGHDDLQKAISRVTQSQAVEPVVRAKPKASARAFVGSSARMQEIQGILGQLARSGAPILIQGETGTGKEVVAREIHALSPRGDRQFLKLNCAALPSELVESELFGYERGAFTGAFQRKAGMFEMADGGTLLLDEIGDMDFRLQAKLLQVLQDHEFQRIGGNELVKVNVRVLAATHQDLEKAIAEGKFREDLFYRLNVINLCVPALRERKDDLLALTGFLIDRHLGTADTPPVITPELQHAMLSYHWPGNVRELENFVRRMIVLCDPDMLARELMSKSNRKALAAAAAATSSGERALPVIPVVKTDSAPLLEQVTKANHQAEVNAILTALNSTRWNRKRAATLLKIDYKALLYKMKRLGVKEKATSADTGGEEQFNEPEIA